MQRKSDRFKVTFTIVTIVSPTVEDDPKTGMTLMGLYMFSVQHRPRYCVNYAEGKGLFFQGSETNDLTYNFLSVLNTGRQLRTWRSMSPFFQGSETNVPTYFLSVLNTACYKGASSIPGSCLLHVKCSNF